MNRPLSRSVLCLVAAALFFPVRPLRANGADPETNLPDLTVSGVLADTDWVSATTESPAFVEALQIELRAIAAATEARIFVVRSLPGVNYLLLHCTPDRPSAAAAAPRGTPPETLGTTEAFRNVVERVRRAVRDLSFVEFCAYNPVDIQGPQPLSWMADSPRPESRPFPEVVPGELVVGLRGGVVPLVRVHAVFTAGNDAWAGRVQARFSRLSPDGSTRAGVAALRPVFFRNGSAEAAVGFLASPGAAAFAVEIDPDDQVHESDETNNVLRTAVDVPPVLFRLSAEAAPTSAGGANAAAVRGVLEIGNFGNGPVRFLYRSVSFRLDGASVRVVWHVDTAHDAAQAPGISVPPGAVLPLPFSLDGPVASGDHLLEADLDSFNLHCKARFRTGPPPPAVNLTPLPADANATAVRVEPSTGDPNIRILLENDAWNAFSDVPLLAEVEIVPAPVMANADNGLFRLWDLEIVLRGRRDLSNSGPRVQALAERLAREWYVEDAWPLPAPILIEDEPERGLHFSDFLPGLQREWRVAVRLDREAPPRSLLRVKLPVERIMDTTVNVEGSILPPLPVVVEFAAELLPPPVPRDGEGIPASFFYRAATPLFHVGRLPAIGFLPLRTDTDMRILAAVDPENRIPESDEEDNKCEVPADPGPGKAEFRAEAFVHWTAPDTALLPNLELTVVGTLNNNSDAPVVLEFPTSLQMDFSWDDRYRWSSGRFFLEMLTTVEVPAGEQHTWEISVPLRELWRAVVPANPAPDGSRMLPTLNLLVELVGTQYRDEVRARLPGNAPALDADGDLLPDAWADAFLGDSDAPGSETAEEDADGDGWDNLFEFLHGTDPINPDDLPDGRLFRLRLLPGWNLISLPVAPEQPEPDALFGDAVLGDIWKWVASSDAPGGEYRPTDRIEPHAAYWVFARREVDLRIPGAPHQTARLRLRPGWTLSGAGGPVRLNSITRARLTVWRWDAEHQRYEPVPDGLMEEGAGYWISAPETVDLNLTGQ
ncbi:MAG: hypothetical protein GXP31_15190 [Kiritimatiellaeota bacterium]|nr:hypothetical protein [Kiritimatiellota bacterium]